MRLSHFWEVLSVNLDHSALKNAAPGKFGLFGLTGFSLFFCSATQFANRSMFSSAFFFYCRGKRRYQMTIAGFWFSTLLRKRCCFWMVAGGPPAGGDLTREVKGHPSIAHLGSLKHPQKQFCFHFSVIVNEQIVAFCSFPSFGRRATGFRQKD